MFHGQVAALRWNLGHLVDVVYIEYPSLCLFTGFEDVFARPWRTLWDDVNGDEDFFPGSESMPGVSQARSFKERLQIRRVSQRRSLQRNINLSLDISIRSFTRETWRGEAMSMSDGLW